MKEFTKLMEALEAWSMRDYRTHSTAYTKQVINAYKEYRAAPKPLEWINVADRLPENKKPMLVYSTTVGITGASRQGILGYWFRDMMIPNVAYWREDIKPPETTDDEIL